MKLKIAIFVCSISVLLAVFATGCAENAVVSSSNDSQKVEVSEEALVEKEFSIGQSKAEETTTTISVNNLMPEKLYIEDFILEEVAYKANDIKQLREEFTQNNEFIDYSYIYKPKQSILSETDVSKVLEFVCYENEYIYAAEKYPLFDTCNIYSHFIICSDEAPTIVGVYEDDYDGIAGNERFIIVSLPQLEDDGDIPYRTYLLLFEDNNGELQILTFADSLDSVHILDYGKFKHFIFGGYGIYGFREHTAIYGVIKGIPKVLIDDRIWFGEDAKIGCFLYHTGWQGFTEIMVYDTINEKYRAIYGYPADNQKLKEIDVEKKISCFYEYDIPDDYAAFLIVSEKYLLGGMGLGSYTYENGSFKEGSALPNWRVWTAIDTSVEWFDVDVDLALERSGATLKS